MAMTGPKPEDLGYEAALDLGVSAFEAGLTQAAVSYLTHAVALRSTRYALVQLAKAHRDLGQLAAARDRLFEARAQPDGEDRYVMVSLAAVLCDLQDYERGLEAARAAIALDPANPAALSVAARCMRELAAVLERSAHAHPYALNAVRAQADDLARRAAASTPEPAGELLRRRRERSVQSRLIPLQGIPTAVPIAQQPGAVLDLTHSTLTPDQPSTQTQTGSLSAPAAQTSWWRRVLDRLRRTEP